MGRGPAAVKIGEQGLGLVPHVRLTTRFGSLKLGMRRPWSFKDGVRGDAGGATPPREKWAGLAVELLRLSLFQKRQSMHVKRTIEKPRRQKSHRTAEHPKPNMRRAEDFEDGYYTMRSTRTVIAAGLANALVLE
jgi:hypothetical protein